MDFLLECIGFPPGTDADDLIRRVRDQGESVPWRGDPSSHRRLLLADGLELRLDREVDQDFWTLLPHFKVPYRLRVAVESLVAVPDSPFDALLIGWAAPPAPEAPESDGQGAYRLAAWLTDARRLPRQLRQGHVLAVGVAGFALEVSYVGPNEGVRDRDILELPHGAFVAPLTGSDSPGGCSEVSLRVKEIRHLRNPITGLTVDVLITDAPERPLLLFLSPWQLFNDGLLQARPGWRIEGTFLFTGRIEGGLPGPRRRLKRAFG